MKKTHPKKKPWYNETAIVLIFFENKSKCFPLLFYTVCMWYSVASVCGSMYATTHGEQLYAIIYMIIRNYYRRVIFSGIARAFEVEILCHL